MAHDHDREVIVHERSGGSGIIIGAVLVIVFIVAVWFFAFGPGIGSNNNNSNNNNITLPTSLPTVVPPAS